MNRLLEVTISGSLVTLLVWGVDRLSAHYTGSAIRRVWWIVAALGFLVPFRVAVLPAVYPTFAFPSVLVSSVARSSDQTAVALVSHERFSWNTILVVAWLTGVVLHFGWALLISMRTQARWSRMRLCTDSALLNLLEDCKSEAGVVIPVGMVLSDSIGTPAVLGWLRPRLLLPTYLVGQLSQQELRLVLLHELAHIRHRDILTNWLFVAARSLHWFNPFAILASRAYRRFAEEAADEAALKSSGEASAECYGHALLTTISQGQAQGPDGGFLFLGESFSNLKQRLIMIRYSNLRKPRWTAGFLFTALLCSLLLVRPAYASVDPAAAKKDAEAAMGPWLAEIDNGAYAKSWDDASSFFRGKVSNPVWVDKIQTVRQPLGKCSSRVVASAEFNDKFPGLVGTEAVMVQYKSSFEGLAFAVETVTFVHDGDSWKAAGYFIRAQ